MNPSYSVKVKGRKLLKSNAACRTLTLWCIVLLSFCSFAKAEQPLTLDTTDTNNYGYAFNGVYTNLQTADFTFLDSKHDLRLTLEAFDIDLANEIEVLVNGKPLTNLNTTNNISVARDTLVIPAAMQIEGMNTLQFKQNITGWIWGISNLHLSNESTQQLQYGVLDTGSYGFGFNSLYTNQNSAQFRFPGSDSNLYLSLVTYDIDTANEVNVLINGQSIGHLGVTASNAAGTATFPIPADMLVANNTLQFAQKTPGLIWGIESLLLKKQGITSELVAMKMDTSKFGLDFSAFFTTLTDIFKSKYLLALMLPSYLIFVFVSERVNPFAISTAPLKKRRLRLGRAAAMASFTSGAIAIFCMTSYQLDEQLALSIYPVLSVLLFIPSIIRYQKSGVWR